MDDNDLVTMKGKSMIESDYSQDNLEMDIHQCQMLLMELKEMQEVVYHIKLVKNVKTGILLHRLSFL